MGRTGVTLDKCPGVRPLGIGKSYQRCIAKGALADAEMYAKAACGSAQLCAGLEAGIEGAIYAVRIRANANNSMQFVPEDDQACEAERDALEVEGVNAAAADSGNEDDEDEDED